MKHELTQAMQDSYKAYLKVLHRSFVKHTHTVELGKYWKQLPESSKARIYAAAFGDFSKLERLEASLTDNTSTQPSNVGLRNA